MTACSDALAYASTFQSPALADPSTAPAATYGTFVTSSSTEQVQVGYSLVHDYGETNLSPLADHTAATNNIITSITLPALSGLPAACTKVFYYVRWRVNAGTWAAWRMKGYNVSAGAIPSVTLSGSIFTSSSPTADYSNINSLELPSHNWTRDIRLFPNPTTAPVLTLDNSGPAYVGSTSTLLGAVGGGWPGGVELGYVFGDGFGGFSMPSPTTTVSGTGNRVTIDPFPVPASVKQIWFWILGGSPRVNGIDESVLIPLPFTPPGDGTSGTIHLEAADSVFWWVTYSELVPFLQYNTSMWAYQADRPPDPTLAPTGAVLSGLSSFPSHQYTHAKVGILYDIGPLNTTGSPTWLDPAPAVPDADEGLSNPNYFRQTFTDLGPLVDLTSASLSDIITIPAMSGHPATAIQLLVYVQWYSTHGTWAWGDNDDVVGLTAVRGPAIVGGASPSFTFPTGVSSGAITDSFSPSDPTTAVRRHGVWGGCRHLRTQIQILQ